MKSTCLNVSNKLLPQLQMRMLQLLLQDQFSSGSGIRGNFQKQVSYFTYDDTDPLGGCQKQIVLSRNFNLLLYEGIFY